MGNGLRARAAYRRAWVLRSVAVTAVVLTLATFLTPLAASAQDWSAPRTVFVPSTGHTTDGLFLDLWRAERDLFGDPVTEEIHPRTDFTSTADAGVVQYYENVALIYLPDEAPENQVQLLDLGRQALEEAKSAGTSRALERALDRSVCAPAGTGTCVNVVASGHTVRGPFLERWQTDETATWLGVPLTESFIAPDGTRVQYFENGIMRQTADRRRRAAAARQHRRETLENRSGANQAAAGRPDVRRRALHPSAGRNTGRHADAWSFGPGPQQGAWKEVVVSISAQTMWAYEEGELVMSSLVSTGTAEVPETTTPVGYPLRGCQV